jgi:signal transduction histidine kinase
MFGNLLSNAVKYSPQGGTITVELAREEREDGPWAIVRVIDQGMGIPPTDLPHIFDKFRRARNVQGQIKGTGLGLASVRQIVEEHGGTVSVKSKEGEGSTFTVCLPVNLLEEEDIE